MSEDPTNATSQVDPQAAKADSSGDENLVDRTQQLIDEVNQLLGKSTSATKNTTSEPAVTSPSATPEAVETPEAVSTPEAVEPPAQPEAVEEADTSGSTSESLKNFLSTLGKDKSDESEQEATTPETSQSLDTSDDESETADVVADAETVETVAESVETVEAVESQADAAEPTDEEESDAEEESSGFDFEALKNAFLEPEAETQTEEAVSYTHLRAHETREDLVCRLLLEKMFRCVD